MALETFGEWIRNFPRLPSNLQFLRSDDTQLTEVGDGNLNDVIRITSKSDASKSVILKHAPPYIKCLGPDYTLSGSRNNIEFRALQKFHEICPGLVPEPYCCDEREHIFLMEDLKCYKDFREEIIKGTMDENVVMDIADFTLRLHQCTNRRRTSPGEFASMTENFRNDEMVDITNQYIFTRPWIRDDPTNRYSKEVKGHHSQIYDDEVLLKHVKDLRRKFLSQKDCLLHGDLHTGSVMTDGYRAKVIDAEFAFVGPAGFDVGLLIANYMFSYYAHLHYPVEISSNFHNRVKNAVKRTIEHYFEGMSPLLSRGELESLTQDTAGLTGCELVRRIVGAAHVADLDNRPLSEIACISLAVKLIRKYKELKNHSELVELLGMD